MAEFSINLLVYVKDNFDFAFKRAHLNERFDFIIVKASDIPSEIKTGLKDYVKGGYWSGKDSYYFVFKAKDVDQVREDDNSKIFSLFKSGFFLSDASEFTSQDVYKCQIGKEDEKPDKIYFVAKAILH